MRAAREYVLVTYYAHPDGRIVMHAYGPWTRAVALSERRKTLAENAGIANFHAKACRMQDLVTP